jgi:hypothetical protein
MKMSTNSLEITKVETPSGQLVNDWAPFKAEDPRIAIIEAAIVGLTLLGATAMLVTAYLVS